MRVFMVRWFARFARQARLTDQNLRAAIDRAERGIIDADLGGGLIKQRVARLGQGRSSGYRMIIAYRVGNRAVFLYGFAKNERENIGPDELFELRKIAAGWLEVDAERITAAIEDGALQEVRNDEGVRSHPIGRGHS